MSSTMLDYESFEIDNGSSDYSSLPEAIEKARAIRNSHAGIFARVEHVGEGQFVVNELPASEVYAEWKLKIQNRLGRILRARMVR